MAISSKPTSVQRGRSLRENVTSGWPSFGSKGASRGPTTGDCVAHPGSLWDLKSNRAVPRSQLVLGAQSSRLGRRRWKG
jgi:hypothetical protein